jgi:SPP1 gp7 family putative phage head morphogenesis protein
MAKPAILPLRPRDPTGVDALERKAIGDFRARLKKIKKAYVEGLDRIPADLAVNAKYAYRLDPGMLNSILGSAGATVDSLLLEGGSENVWFFQQYVSLAYARGAAQEHANLKNQSPVYQAARGTLAEVVNRPAYRNRIALIASREYEEMLGLGAEVKKNMGRVLTDGVARGRNPREVAKDLTRQLGIEESRARRIARTEITTALRRARWDEHDDAVDDLGLTFKLMHYSALSPTTRRGHAERHALLYTSEEVREWYSKDGNSINCKCNQISVLVDEDGAPVVPRIIERARATEKKMRARGEGPWATDERKAA